VKGSKKSADEGRSKKVRRNEFCLGSGKKKSVTDSLHRNCHGMGTSRRAGLLFFFAWLSLFAILSPALLPPKAPGNQSLACFTSTGLTAVCPVVCSWNDT